MKMFTFILIAHFFVFTSAFSAETQYFTSFDGTKIAYTDEGKGQAVILIHGFISNRKSWDNTALKKSLLDRGFRVVIPDLRGNGESEKPHEETAYSGDAEIKDLMELANHLQLKEYQAVGYSRGAIVLAKLLTQDKRIKKGVLGGIGLDFTNPNWDRKLMFAEAFGGKSYLYPETQGAVNYAKSIGADTLVLSLLQKFQPVTSQNELGKIKIPVLVIAGDLDVDNGKPQDLAATLPKSQLEVVKGDHNNAHKTQEFADTVIGFLKSKK
jgi:pimeloyl-ACP methyl ester carboxylesterase